VINQLFEEITKEYSLQILKWAYKKCGDGYRAEELAQEVLTQVFSAIQKSKEAGKTIEQMEHFIWRIAHYVWCHSLRGSSRYVMCSMEEDIRDESDFVSELADQEEQKLLVVELRKQISRLNYLQREILVSFYIDGLPQKTIANRLGISESVVKWHLHDTRRKLKKELTENMEKKREEEYIYRPRELCMAICGEVVQQVDTKEVENSLVRQNICIACYQQPKSLDELTTLLGIPKAYLEFDLKWLVEHEFVTCEKGKYSTTFYINSRSEIQKSYGIHCSYVCRLGYVQYTCRYSLLVNGTFIYK
jgi:RNA polymerase sigma factor (sigma-70 family)